LAQVVQPPVVEALDQILYLQLLPLLEVGLPAQVVLVVVVRGSNLAMRGLPIKDLLVVLVVDRLMVEVLVAAAVQAVLALLVFLTQTVVQEVQESHLPLQGLR
tara:strand:- start:166 stop:474 length:309 start_codon:yes stop_codon:yes gene_type:complete